jgi:HlyD family secretion protein
MRVSLAPISRSCCQLVASIIALAFCLGCDRKERDVVQGYVEGEFVYVASPLPGALQELFVERGAHVTAGQPLFALESGAEIAAHDEAAKRLEEGRARLEDARKGLRPPEIDALEAQLRQSRAALVLSEKEFERQKDLFRTGASSAQDLDRARSAAEQDKQRVSQQEADLKTAQLGSRTDQIAAAEANVRALQSALAKAEWDLSQKRQNATQPALVFDTLYRPGEWVAAGRPVVVMLPPENIEVRAFVPQTRIAAIHPGDRVNIHVDGISEAFTGKVSFISPRAEYTPPVIYSQESRGKLVFLVEAVLAPATAAKLHPGQPVDVQFAQ